MKTIEHWLPTIFCAFLSLMAVFYEGGFTLFACFLPMVFFYLASVTLRLNREIDKLQKRTDARPTEEVTRQVSFDRLFLVILMLSIGLATVFLVRRLASQ